jgi:hypothetical protein
MSHTAGKDFELHERGLSSVITWDTEAVKKGNEGSVY